MSIFKTALLLTALTLLLVGIGYFIAGPVGASIAFFIALMMNLDNFLVQ